MYQNGKNITFIDRSIGSVNHILRDIDKSEPLTPEKEYDLWDRMQQGSMRAREQLINANLRYVANIAKKYLASGAAFEDLYQAGSEGLTKAVDKFNGSLGFRLISYATWFVENEIHKTAYDHIHHKYVSLDEPINDEEEEGDTKIARLKSYHSQAADWNMLYADSLDILKARVDKRRYGMGPLTADLHQMLCRGYTTSDFARKHHLSDLQMDSFLTILREEANHTFRHAA